MIRGALSDMTYLFCDLMPQPNWPKTKPDGNETKIYEGHPLTKWLAKIFNFDPNTYKEIPKFTWDDPILIDKAAMSLSSPFTVRKMHHGQQYILLAHPEQIEIIKKAWNKS